MSKTEVLNFVAEEQVDKVLIKWSTRNEASRIRFEIQRAEDGQNFATISSFLGKAAGKPEFSYEVIDYKVNNFEAYKYRMKRIFSNGLTSYYAPMKVVSPILAEWKEASKIAVDPGTGLLKVKYRLESPGNVVIRMMSNDQKEVSKSEYENQRKGNYLKSIDMKRMPKGRYWLVIKTKGEVISRFQVQHGA